MSDIVQAPAADLAARDTGTPTRVAMLSFHTSPLAPLGGRETGGMNVYVREVARQLGVAGVLVDVFTRRTDPAQPLVVPLGPGARLIHIEAGAAARIEKEDLLPLVAPFAAGVQAFAAGEAIRYDLVHAHYWLSAAAGEMLARGWGVPLLAMFHTLAEVKLRARASEREPAERREAERRLVHVADRVVAATEHERQLLRQIYGVPSQRVAVIPLGVDVERFRPREQAAARAALGLPLDEHVVLAVGRLEPLKGFDILIGALAEMTERSHTRLLIVGGDATAAAERTRLMAVADAAGVADRVRFVGAVPHEQLPDWYAAADVVAVPSFYESFGLVAVEALASGTPVVASRVGGLTSTVRDGRTGYLVPWRCPGPFAEKIDLLLGNESLRQTLGRAAADSMQQYAWSAVASGLRTLYASVLAAGAGAASREALAVGGA